MASQDLIYPRIPPETLNRDREEDFQYAISHLNRAKNLAEESKTSWWYWFFYSKAQRLSIIAGWEADIKMYEKHVVFYEKQRANK